MIMYWTSDSYPRTGRAIEMLDLLRKASVRFRGVRTAIITLAMPACVFSGSASGQEMPRLALIGEPVFISESHPDRLVAQIGRLDGAVLIGSSQVAFVDGVTQTLGFLDSATGATWTAQDVGGDSELGPPLRLLGRADGLIATDRNGSITVFNSDGVAVERTAYDPFAVSFASPARAVGIFPNRRLIFRRSENAPPGFSLTALTGSKGRQRDTVRYETPTIGETATVVARGLDDERIALTTRVDGVTSSGSERVLFGQRLLEATVGEHLAVAQTDRANIVVYDRSGTQIAALPMPGARRRVTEEEVRGQRVIRIRERLRENEVRRKAKERSYAENFGAVYSPGRDSVRIAQLPANDVAPPIDRMIGDLDGRIWLRLFAMPRDTVVYWRVWTIGQDISDFDVALPRAMQLLDATGDMLLLRTISALGTDAFVIQQIGEVIHGHDQLPARSSRKSVFFSQSTPCTT